MGPRHDTVRTGRLLAARSTARKRHWRGSGLGRRPDDGLQLDGQDEIVTRQTTYPMGCQRQADLIPARQTEIRMVPLTLGNLSQAVQECHGTAESLEGDV